MRNMIFRSLIAYSDMGSRRPVKFYWVNKPILCQPIILEILRARGGKTSLAEASFDLGLSVETCRITRKGIEVRNELVEWDKLEGVADRERDIYYIEDGELVPVHIIGKHFYKLVFVKLGHPPTLEIDGIHMHRVKDVTPDIDTRMKISLLGRLECSSVLDTCMGLGYTAIESLKRGACRITTFEIDENVLRIASLNPWSKWLEDERVEIYRGDVFEGVEEYSGFFDAVIHDPPRISLAGELYSLEFYVKLSRALRPGGRIAHYVGQPGICAGKKIWRGVMERMRQAGFRVKYDPPSRCVYGKKIH